MLTLSAYLLKRWLAKRMRNKLCRLFGVGIADLYGESGDLAPISNDERDLVDTYRDLTSPHKHVLLAVARELRAAQGKE